MAIKLQLEKHTVAYPSDVLARNGGKHIYNIELDKPCDNGWVVAKDSWKGQQYYGVKESTAVAAVVLEQSARGNWYVEITEPGDGLFVYMPPVIEENFTKSIGAESHFYNEKGEVVKGYELAKGDIVEVSELGFTGTPQEKKNLTIENRKWKVGE